MAALHQNEELEPRQGASAQGGGKRRGASVAHMHAGTKSWVTSRQRARAEPLRQPLHAVGAGCLEDANDSSAGSTEPTAQQPRSAAVRPLNCQTTCVASRSSLQLRSPDLVAQTLRPPRGQSSAVAAAPASPRAARC